MTGSGHLLVAILGGSIAAPPFDAGTGKISGAPEYLADRVYVSRNGGWWNYAVSSNGTLLYRLGGFHPHGIAFVQADGSARTLRRDLEGVAHYDSPRFTPAGGGWGWWRPVGTSSRLTVPTSMWRPALPLSR